MSCGVGLKHSSDPELLWPWHRLAAVALIPPLAWEPPCAVGAALKRQEEKKKKEVGRVQLDGVMRMCIGKGFPTG